MYRECRHWKTEETSRKQWSVLSKVFKYSSKTHIQMPTEFCAYTQWSVVLFAKMASVVSVSDKKLTWLAGKDQNPGLKELAHAERGGRGPEARDVCWSEMTRYSDVPG